MTALEQMGFALIYLSRKIVEGGVVKPIVQCGRILMTVEGLWGLVLPLCKLACMFEIFHSGFFKVTEL